MNHTKHYIFFGLLALSSTCLFAQPRGLPLDQVSGKTMDIQEQAAAIVPRVQTPDSIAPADTGTGAATLVASPVTNLACPQQAELVAFVKEGLPLCSNGYILTPEGPVDAHCEYLHLHQYRANFNGCDLSGMDFEGMVLQGADFSGATLSNTNFSRADLRYAIFSRARIFNSRFEQANLASSIWHDATIRDSGFSRATLTSASMWPEQAMAMLIENSRFDGIEGPLYTRPGTHWINSVCADGNNSEINPRRRRSCEGRSVVVGI